MAEFYNRDKLYNEVWEAPMIEVCKRYGISDVGLVKICKKLRVTTPPRGYWAKRAVGKEPNTPRLIKYDHAPKILIRHVQDPKPRSNPEAFAEVNKLILKITDITISDDLENLHPYIRNTRKVFKRRIKKGWKNDYNRISVTGDAVFDIDIGDDSLDRASNILQSLCFAVVYAGGDVVLDDKYGAGFRIMNETIFVKISESTKKMPLKEKVPDKYHYHDYKFIPSGIFKLEINTNSFSMNKRKYWTDGKSKRIENKLVDVAQHLIRAAAWKKEYEALREKREEDWRIEQEKQVERDRLA